MPTDFTPTPMTKKQLKRAQREIKKALNEVAPDQGRYIAYWQPPPQMEGFVCACCGREIIGEHYFEIRTNGVPGGKINLCNKCRYHPVCMVCGKTIHEIQCWLSIGRTGRSQCKECLNNKIKKAPEPKKSRGHFIEWRE